MVRVLGQDQDRPVGGARVDEPVHLEVDHVRALQGGEHPSRGGIGASDHLPLTCARRLLERKWRQLEIAGREHVPDQEPVRPRR